jgi:hypothetical protein
VVDATNGTGDEDPALTAFGAFVVGMDVSPNAIEVAMRRAELDAVSDRTPPRGLRHGAADSAALPQAGRQYRHR